VKPSALASLPLDLEPSSGHAPRICIVCMTERTVYRVAGLSVSPDCWARHQEAAR